MTHSISALFVITLLQLCRAEISEIIPGKWFAANAISDDFSPKSISEIFSTETTPGFSQTKPIIVLPPQSSEQHEIEVNNFSTASLPSSTRQPQSQHSPQTNTSFQPTSTPLLLSSTHFSSFSDSVSPSSTHSPPSSPYQESDSHNPTAFAPISETVPHSFSAPDSIPVIGFPTNPQLFTGSQEDLQPPDIKIQSNLSQQRLSTPLPNYIYESEPNSLSTPLQPNQISSTDEVTKKIFVPPNSPISIFSSYPLNTMSSTHSTPISSNAPTLSYTLLSTNSPISTNTLDSTWDSIPPSTLNGIDVPNSSRYPSSANPTSSTTAPTSTYPPNAFNTQNVISTQNPGNNSSSTNIPNVTVIPSSTNTPNSTYTPNLSYSPNIPNSTDPPNWTIISNTPNVNDTLKSANIPNSTNTPNPIIIPNSSNTPYFINTPESTTSNVSPNSAKSSTRLMPAFTDTSASISSGTPMQETSRPTVTWTGTTSPSTPCGSSANRKPSTISTTHLPMLTQYDGQFNPLLKIRVVVPKGSITNIKINPTTTTKRPTTRRTKRPKKNTYDSCVHSCKANEDHLCAVPLGTVIMDPKIFRGFPSICHMACHNTFRKQLYEKIADGRCGRLRTRIIKYDTKTKIQREDLKKTEYDVVNDDQKPILEFVSLD